MFRCIAFILSASAALSSGFDLEDPSNAGIQERIWLGKTAKPGQFPYQALLFMKLKDGSAAFCGGSLVADNFVLTAAHCCDNVDYMTVYLGLNNIADINCTTVVKQNVTGENIIMHEQYDPKTISNDICLLRLTETVEMTANISTVALPTKQDTNPGQYDLKFANITGFGQTNDFEGIHPQLMWSTVLMKPHSFCSLYYIFINRIPSSQLCSAKFPWTGPCHGDSGGPITINDSSGNPVEIGLVSWGVGSCASFNPVVYTYVSAFVDWLTAKMTPL